MREPFEFFVLAGSSHALTPSTCSALPASLSSNRGFSLFFVARWLVIRMVRSMPASLNSGSALRSIAGWSLNLEAFKIHGLAWRVQPLCPGFNLRWVGSLCLPGLASAPHLTSRSTGLPSAAR